MRKASPKLLPGIYAGIVALNPDAAVDHAFEQ